MADHVRGLSNYFIARSYINCVSWYNIFVNLRTRDKYEYVVMVNIARLIGVIF